MAREHALVLTMTVTIAIFAPAHVHSQFTMDDDVRVPAPPTAPPPGQATVDEGIEDPGTGSVPPQFSILSPWENIQRDLGIPQ